MASTGLIIGIVAAVVVLLIIYIYNSLIRLRMRVNNAWSQIDVQLKRRYDLIPNLVSAVKGYMKHEKKVLVELTKARASILNAQTLPQKARADGAITKALKTLFAVSENYPVLRANENFMQLQGRISGLENEIADRREFYNDGVTNYNTRIQSFPDIMIAKMLSYSEEALFKATEQEKKTVNIEV